MDSSYTLKDSDTSTLDLNPLESELSSCFSGKMNDFTNSDEEVLENLVKDFESDSYDFSTNFSETSSSNFGTNANFENPTGLNHSNCLNGLPKQLSRSRKRSCNLQSNEYLDNYNSYSNPSLLNNLAKIKSISYTTVGNNLLKRITKDEKQYKRNFKTTKNKIVFSDKDNETSGLRKKYNSSPSPILEITNELVNLNLRKATILKGIQEHENDLIQLEKIYNQKLNELNHDKNTLNLINNQILNCRFKENLIETNSISHNYQSNIKNTLRTSNGAKLFPASSNPIISPKGTFKTQEVYIDTDSDRELDSIDCDLDICSSKQTTLENPAGLNFFNELD